MAIREIAGQKLLQESEALRDQSRPEKGRSRKISSGSRQAVYESVADGLAHGRNNDWDFIRCALRRLARWRRSCNDDVDPGGHQLFREPRKLFDPAFRRPRLDDVALTFRIAELAHALPESNDTDVLHEASGDQESDAHGRRCLRAHCRRAQSAGKEPKELTPSHCAPEDKTEHRIGSNEAR